MSDAATPHEMIPVTLLTGFLGAGKTTLLNSILKQPEMAGTAVLVNEFGEIGLDHLLVETLDEDTVLLSAGCLCCTVRGDLVEALARIRTRQPARVLIETTGLADPVPIIQTLLGDPFVAMFFRMDGIVTVVDAVNGGAQLNEQQEAVRQAAVADRIVLSKTDLIDAGELRARLTRLNPGAPILESVKGAVPAAGLLNLGLFAPEGKIPDVQAWLNQEAFEAEEDHHDHGHDHDHEHHHDHDHGHDHGRDHNHAHGHLDRNRHDEHVRAFSMTFEQPLHWDGVGRFLEILIATHGDSLLRVKGILNLEGLDKPVAIHGVRALFHSPEVLPDWPAGDDRSSRLVFIVRDDLDRETVEEGIKSFEEAARKEIRLNAV
jgi:G3E family GTPase